MKYLLTIFLIALSYFTPAQTNTSNQLYFNFIGVKDGLPEGTVKALLQDSYGYIWIGTQTGIVRYDGYKLKVYNPPTKDSIPVYASVLFEDKRGRLWLGTNDDGIYLYNRNADSFINYVPPFQNNNANNIYIVQGFQDDDEGNMWIKMHSAQGAMNLLAYFNTSTKQFTFYGKDEKGKHFINANSFNDFLKDKNGTIWVGSDNGIYNYDAKQDLFKAHFSTKDTLQQRSFWKLTQDKQHPELIYCGSWYSSNPEHTSGLFRFNIHTNDSTSFVHDAKNINSIGSNDVWQIFQPDKTHLLVGTLVGLSTFNTVTQTFTNYQPEATISTSDHTVIKDIKPDKKGGYWCETGTGILYFNNITKEFTRYNYSSKIDNGIRGRDLHNLIVDNSGNIWFGVEQQGLQWLNVSKSKFIYYGDNPNISGYFPGGTVNSITETKDGNFWIGSNKGLYNWQPASNTFTLLDNAQIKNATIVAVTADKEGLLWFRAFGGNAQGVYVYNPRTKEIKNYRHNNKDSTSLANDNIQHIAEDSSGNIWLGSAGNGISRINKITRRITNYPFIANNGLNTDIAIKHGMLDDDEVQTIYVDKKGIVYIGTNNGSFNTYNAATDKFIPVNKALYKGLYCVISIYNDSKNRLWAGTYMTGIYYKQNNEYKKFLNPQSLLYNGSWGMAEDNNNNLWSLSPRGLTIIDSNNNTRNITAVNGLPQEPDYFLLYKATNGNFFYGCKTGFVQFNPADFSADTTRPILHIESISFSHPSSDEDSTITTFDTHEIQLQYNENRITFNYTGLLYQNTASIQYAYKLNGYDDDWINAGDDRDVTYTNLSPGTYTFHVKAANSDGVWTKKDEAITITITPPWWKTWWAYVLYSIIVIGGISAYVAYRSAKLKRENKLLEDKVDERTSQLNQSLSELKSTQTQLIQSEKMASLGELTAGIAHEIQNPLNFVNNFSEVNSELIDEMNAESDPQEIRAIANDIKQNNEKIAFHGRRADAIVKGMLQHSRQTKGVKEPTDINALCDEYLKLSYHGLRAKDKSFNADINTEFDESIGTINIVSQNIGRVLLNLFNNAFYAVNERKKSCELSGISYQPTVSVTTKKINDKVEITISDNGTGIPQNIIDKIFQPFFTTKPTGQGTGLGLSLAYDIVTKEHNGKLKVNSNENEGSVFLIELPC